MNDLTMPEPGETPPRVPRTHRQDAETARRQRPDDAILADDAELAALREREAQQAFLLELSDTVRARRDAGAILSETYERLGEWLDVDRAYYVELDEETNVAVVERDWVRSGAPSLAGRHRVSEFAWSVEILRRGGCHVIADTQRSPLVPPADRAASAALRIFACMGAPLIKDGRLVGALCVTSSRPREWAESEVALLRRVADTTRAAVERSRAEAALARSEDRYRTLFESIDEGFVVADLLFDESGRPYDLVVRETNPSFDRMMRTTNAVGKRALEIFPDAEASWFEAYGRVVETGESERFENYLAPLDRWFALYISRVGTADSRRFVIVFNDVTERKRAETALTASEDRQSFLLELSDALRPLTDPVAIQAEAMRVLGEHIGAVRAVYWEVEADGGHFLSEGGYAKGMPHLSRRILASDFGVRVIEAMSAGQTLAVADAATDALVSDAERAAYEAIDVRAYIGVPFVKEGRLVAALGVYHPAPHVWTTEEVALAEATAERTWAAVGRARAEAAVEIARADAEEARREAEQANRAKSEFLAAMSHELRTPLNAISGYVQLLEMGIHGPLTAPQRLTLSRVQTSGQHLLSLINGVLNFAKLEAGRVEYRTEAVPLADVVASVTQLIEPQLEARRLTSAVAVDSSSVARADREKVQQVLLNLLSNAVKFTGPGGRITIDTPTPDSAPADVVLLRVSDTGGGIPREMQESIFDPFVQVDRRLTRTMEGTGLGLAISRELARAMGGDLTVASTVGEGSVFTLQLPRADRTLSDKGRPATAPTA